MYNCFGEFVIIMSAIYKNGFIPQNIRFEFSIVETVKNGMLIFRSILRNRTARMVVQR